MMIRGGRVIDPGPGLDMFVDLAIKDTRAAAVGPDPCGRIVLDATGCVTSWGSEAWPRAIVDECEDAV